MLRRKLLWFAGVGLAALLAQDVTARAQGSTQIVLSRTEGPFMLDAGTTRIPLRAVPTRAGAKARSLAALLNRVQPDEHVLLVLRGLHAAAPTTITVQIFLGLSEGETPASQDDPHYAGTVNFANVARPAGAGGVQGPDQFDSFDVSDVIQNLRTAKKLTDPVHITLHPVGKPAEGSKPSISRVDLVLQ